MTESLDLSDNYIESSGTHYIANMLRENTFIISMVRIILSFVWQSEETRLKSQKMFSCKMTECKVFSLCLLLFEQHLKTHTKSTS